MSDGPKSHSWWQTLPGVLTAIAGIITAVAGLVVALQNFNYSNTPNKPATQTTDTSTSSTTPKQGSDLQPEPVIIKTPTSPTDTPKKNANLLASENGGHLIVASGDNWLQTIDGHESFNQIDYGLREQSEAVYAFRDERVAVLDTFTILINQSGDNNVKEFELFAGNDSPTGPFESIGIFTTQNAKLFKTPYQEFKIPKVTAKYLKIKLLSTYGAVHPVVDEIQAFGYLSE